jgi:hypothetical protein
MDGEKMTASEVNYFMADQAFYNSPFSYLDELRRRGRVYQEPHQGVYMVAAWRTV